MHNDCTGAGREGSDNPLPFLPFVIVGTIVTWAIILMVAL